MEISVDMRIGAICIITLLSLSTVGCMRRQGRNTDCEWPGETPRQPADARHLSADAEFAEDLAIRYADTHFGLRTPGFVSGEDYVAARDRCMASLFAAVAKEHGVPVGAVSGALGRNRGRVDLGINLPFLLLYGLCALAAARWLWRKYPPAENGWLPGIVLGLFLSLALATACLMLGEVWGWIAEGRRTGNPHMTYRVDRLWWVKHRLGLFIAAATAFWLAGAATASAFCSGGAPACPGADAKTATDITSPRPS
jgi:hypothetical protein